MRKNSKFIVQHTYLCTYDNQIHVDPLKKLQTPSKYKRVCTIHIWHYQFLTSWPSLPHVMSCHVLTFLSRPTHLFVDLHYAGLEFIFRICDHQYFLDFWIYPLLLIIQKIMTSYMGVPKSCILCFRWPMHTLILW